MLYKIKCLVPFEDDHNQKAAFVKIQEQKKGKKGHIFLIHDPPVSILLDPAKT